MKIGRVRHTASLLLNGKVLVTGGYDVSFFSSSELYDPSTELWTDTGDMNSARDGHTASVLANGKVLVIGGDRHGIHLNSVELYDPLTELWTNASDMNYSRYGHTATILTNEKVLVAGGTNSTHLNSAELYSWT